MQEIGEELGFLTMKSATEFGGARFGKARTFAPKGKKVDRSTELEF